MLNLATSEKRILLTRDMELHVRARDKFRVPSLLVSDNNVLQQLEHVREHFALTFPSEPTILRCSFCNGMIQIASDEVVQQSREIKMLSKKGVNIAEFIQRHEEFYACASCGKVFWKGSHWKGIQQKVHHLSTRTCCDCSA